MMFNVGEEVLVRWFGKYYTTTITKAEVWGGKPVYRDSLSDSVQTNFGAMSCEANYFKVPPGHIHLKYENPYQVGSKVRNHGDQFFCTFWDPPYTVTEVDSYKIRLTTHDGQDVGWRLCGDYYQERDSV